MAAKTFEDWWKTEWHSDEEAGFLACWNAAIDTMEAQNTGAQQLKPKMPRVEDIIDSVVGAHMSIHDQSVVAGIRGCYRYISRHFGH